MRPFPTKLLRPTRGKLFGRPDQVRIEIELDTFSLDGLEGPVTTSVRLDHFVLPTLIPSWLAGKEFKFPVNPHEGYIDGSIYIDSAHHPVDVTAIRFGSCVGGVIAAELEMILAFEFESLCDFADTEWTCQTKLHVTTGT